jgi:hypothetical protein
MTPATRERPAEGRSTKGSPRLPWMAFLKLGGLEPMTLWLQTIFCRVFHIPAYDNGLPAKVVVVLASSTSDDVH